MYGLTHAGNEEDFPTKAIIQGLYKNEIEQFTKNQMNSACAMAVYSLYWRDPTEKKAGYLESTNHVKGTSTQPLLQLPLSNLPK